MELNYDEILAKAERILKENTYNTNVYPWGNYRMISPSKNFFKGIWNWDSAFHAIGMIPFNLEIAKEQILGFIQFQQDDGMLPDVICETGEVVTSNTKPPVMGYAAYRVYNECKDMDFAKKVFECLIKNEQFWVKKRMYEDMFYYDADSDKCKDDAEYRSFVGFESGWDNSPRWDKTPQHIWPVDLNCYMYLTYKSLSFFARELGEDSNIWELKAERLKYKIETKLWNTEMLTYADFNFMEKSFIKVLTPASFMPLFVGIASAEHGVHMNAVACKSFLPGMPTVAYDSPLYNDKDDDAYWRGPTWLNVAYFAAKGLKKYGFDETADTIKNTILGWIQNSGNYIYENYNATTGKGLCQKDFSWSCVFAREFITNF